MLIKCVFVRNNVKLLKSVVLYINYVSISNYSITPELMQKRKAIAYIIEFEVSLDSFIGPQLVSLLFWLFSVLSV